MNCFQIKWHNHNRGEMNNPLTHSPSAISSYSDLDGHPSSSVGHTPGSSHVEQMHSDLGSDWRKELRRKGEWMMYWEFGVG